MQATIDSNLSQSWFEFSRAVRKRRSTVRIFMVTTVCIVVVGSFLQTPIYRASATVLIDLETPTVLAVSTSRDDSTVAEASYMSYAGYYRTQLEIITGRSMAEKVFRTFHQENRPEYRGKPDPILLFLRRVKVEPIKQTRLIKIHVEDRDPKLAARIANEFAANLCLENLARTSMTEYMTLKKNEYLKLQAKETELSKRYKNKHPAIVRIHKEMEQLAGLIEKETRHQTNPGVEVSASPDYSALAGGLRPNNIRVQDFASTPVKPIRPKRLLNLLLGLCFGFLGGIGLAVAQEQMDTSLRGPEDIEQDSSLVLLGHVPRIESVKGSPSTEFLQHWKFSNVEVFSPAAEAYRAIRTTLLYALPPDRGRVILFTSPGPGEGKTTTVSNLSVAIARSGEKILLIDADLRKGRLQDVFNVKRSPGLSEFLTGQATLEQIIQKTEVEGLEVVSCGIYPPYPAELVGSAQLVKLIEAVSSKYGRVFIDSPPILAVTDAAVIAAKVKTVVAVAQSGTTPRQALLRLSDICREMRAKLLGVILNNVPVWGAPYHYRYSSYGYSPRQKDQGGFQPLSSSQ